MIRTLIASAALLMLPAAASAGQIILTPASVIGASGYYQGFGNAFEPGAIFSQQTGTIDETFASGYWINPDNGPASAYITVDLGAAYSLSTIQLFNTHNGGYNDRGTGSFTITASNSVADVGGGNFVLTGASTVIIGTLTPEANGTPLTAQSFTASGSYRYISFNTSGVSTSGTPCCGANVYGLDELRVFDAASVVPEPQVWAMFVIGFGVIGTAMRRSHALTA